MLDKEGLKAKEEKLRRELSEASDEFEGQMLRAAGMAVVGGLVSFLVYKLVSSGDDDSEYDQETDDKKQVITKVEPYRPGFFARVVNALIPVVVSGIGAEILKSLSTDNEPEPDKTIIIDPDTES